MFIVSAEQTLVSLQIPPLSWQLRMPGCGQWQVTDANARTNLVGNFHAQKLVFQQMQETNAEHNSAVSFIIISSVYVSSATTTKFIA